jgi:hypothetical protein
MIFVNGKDKPATKARFEIFMEIRIQVAVFWIVTPCSDAVGCHPDDGFITVLRSVGILHHQYTGSQHRSLEKNCLR